MDQNIYTGKVIDYIGRGEVTVWIPLKGPIPLGMAKWIYGNTGSVMDGENLATCTSASFKCRLISPVQPSGYWNPQGDKAANFFGNGYREGDPIPFYPALISKKKGKIFDNYAPRRSPNIPSRITMRQSLGAAEYMAHYILQSIGGDPIPTYTNLPKGQFSKPTPGETVVVAFHDYSVMPGVLGVLPDGDQYEHTIDRV